MQAREFVKDLRKRFKNYNGLVGAGTTASAMAISLSCWLKTAAGAPLARRHPTASLRPAVARRGRLNLRDQNIEL